MQTDNKHINMLELLDGIEFPISRENAIVFANHNGASVEAANLLRALPEKTFNSMQEINESIGKMRHPKGEENLFSSAPQDFSDNTIKELK